ncbi:hypothetical protein PFISCL1PPCAC_5155, partial [Pristionchus fissidentatus]
PGSAIHYNFAEHCLSEDVNDEAFHGLKEVKNSISCYGKRVLPSYMQRMDVQTALHISNLTTSTRPWS